MSSRQRSRFGTLFFMPLACALLGVTACGTYLSGAPSGSQVIEFTPAGIRYGSVALSPDRRLLACVRSDHDRGVHDIQIMPLDETTPSPAVIVANGEAPIWLSDERVLFFRNDAQGNGDIWMASVSRPDAHSLTVTPAAEVSASVAPDGRRLLIARATIVRDRKGLFSGWEQEEIVLAEIRDDRMHEIAVLARGDAGRGDPSSPNWSPDGRRFVYVRETRHRGPRNDVYVMNADGSDDRLLVQDAVPVAWAADGRSVYYQARPGDDTNGEVRQIGIDGVGSRRVVADAHVPASATVDAQWNLRRDRLALASEALVGAYDAAGFRTPTGIVLLNDEGEVQLDLRRAGRMDTVQGAVQWDARDRLVFARHVAWQWRDQGVRGGIFSLDPGSGEERTILADTETFTGKRLH